MDLGCWSAKERTAKEESVNSVTHLLHPAGYNVQNVGSGLEKVASGKTEPSKGAGLGTSTVHKLVKNVVNGGHPQGAELRTK